MPTSTSAAPTTRSTFDKIDKEISVVGLNNTVTYKDGDPKVNDTGSNNKISKG